MSSPVNDILDNIISALRTSGHFAEVTLGPPPAGVAVPRAWVVYRGLDTFRPDDTAASCWRRLRGQVVIRTRSDRRHEGVMRAEQLCRLAADALLADIYRGGLCCDLPIGRATQIGRREPKASAPHPQVEMTCDFRCHFEQQGGQ